MRLPTPIHIEGKTAIAHLDFLRIQQMGFRGITRGLYFAEAGLASQLDLEEFRRVHIGGLVKDKIHYTIAPTPSKQEEIDHIKENFEIWCTNNGLREMLETFHAFIDEVLWFETVKKITESKKITVEDFDELAENFATKRKQLAFNEKLSELVNVHKFKFSNDFRDSLLSLQKIRHCLAHNLGIISDEYFQKDKQGNARITWQTMNLYLQGQETGKKKKLKMGKVITEPSNVILSFERHVKTQPFNTELKFTLDELKDIAASLHRAVLAMGGEIQRKYGQVPEEKVVK